MPAFVDLSNQTFGRLTVIECVARPSESGGDSYWRCQCSCGNETIVSRGNLKNGSTQSCGCLRNVQGGLSNKHPLWFRWVDMFRRCYNPHDKDFRRYGKRGITVCERWHSFPLFLEDMESSFFEGATIERVDNNGHYEPLNCVWIPPQQQRDNQHHLIFINTPWGIMTRSQAAKMAGVSIQIFISRIKMKWSIDRLFDPANARKLHRWSRRKVS